LSILHLLVPVQRSMLESGPSTNDPPFPEFLFDLGPMTTSSLFVLMRRDKATSPSFANNLSTSFEGIFVSGGMMATSTFFGITPSTHNPLSPHCVNTLLLDPLRKVTGQMGFLRHWQHLLSTRTRLVPSGQRLAGQDCLEQSICLHGPLEATFTP